MAGEVVGTAYVEIRPKTDGFANEAQSKIAAPLQAAFGAIATGLAAQKVKSFFTDSFAEANQAVKVTAQTEAVLKSTGEQAGVSAKHIEDYAQKLSDLAAIDDEVIQQGENVLLTFTSVRNEVGKGNDVFDRAVLAATNLSAALGTDLQGSIIQVGKALQDPIVGLTALRRVGVSFTEQQKEQIATLQQSGDLLGAQKIILQELEKEFGGAAASQATATAKLSVAFKNLEESIGTALLPLINGLAKALQPLAQFLSDNKIAATALAVVLSGALLAGLTAYTIRMVQATLATFGFTAAEQGAGIATSGLATSIGEALVALGPYAIALAALIGIYAGLQERSKGWQVSVNTAALAKLTDAQLRVNAAATIAAFGFDKFREVVKKTATDSIGAARAYVAAADLTKSQRAALVKIIDEEEAAQARAAARAGATANALDGQTDSTKELVDWTNILVGKLNDQTDASLGSQGAAVSMDRAIQNLNETLATNAANTLEGRDATISAEQSVVSFGKKIYDERQALVGSEQALRDQIGALSGVRDSLDPGSPLRQFLNGYIDDLMNRLPDTAETRILLTLANETGLSIDDLRGFRTLSAVLPQFQSGGIIPGPVGAPRLVVAHGGEEVIPVGGSSTSGGDVHFHIDGPLPDPVTFGLRTARVQRVYMQMAGR